jgi:MFS family permease
MHFFTSLFISLCLVCAIVMWSQRKEGSNAASGKVSLEFRKSQRIYLAAYLCAVIADWLQGPYVYALYEHYKFSKQEIGVLFIAGFGSSAVFGTFTGEFADRYGRKLACLMYCALYGISCLTKHSPSFWWLLVGRITGGIATSILYSCFESWLVANHNLKHFPSELLSNTFSLASSGNAIVAIASGWMGGFVRDTFDSLVAPFDLANFFCILCAGVIMATWQENKGEAGGLPTMKDPNAPSKNRTKMALLVLQRDPKVAILGITQSLFEGSMYIFVFMWTPKLEPHWKDLPHSRVFGCFMASMTLGSALIGPLQKRYSPEVYMRYLFAISAVLMAITASGVADGYTTTACFLIFEGACGVYFPSMGVVKSKYVPEEVRATIYNIFRIPLNIIVCTVLANLKTFSGLFLDTLATHKQRISNTLATHGRPKTF